MIPAWPVSIEFITRPVLSNFHTVWPLAVDSAQALSELGIPSKARAKELLTELGRRGPLPWCLERDEESLSYISAGNILLVPVDHCLLRGVLRTLLVHCICTNVSDIDPEDAIAFRKPNRDRARVRTVRACLYMLALDWVGALLSVKLFSCQLLDLAPGN